MDSALSEKIVLEIATNLNTRFVVLPLRSETVGDVRGPIKSYHMDLFPSWGEVDVHALEVELSGGMFRLSDCESIRELFWRQPQGKFFAELIPLSTKPTELPRLNIAGATGANVVFSHELNHNPAESTPSPRRRLAEGQNVPNLGASSDKKSDLDCRVVAGRHGHGSKTEVVETQLKTMKRGSDERDCPSDAGESQVQAECGAVDVRKPATNFFGVDRGHPVSEHIQPETGGFTENQTMLVVESTTRLASCGEPEHGEQLQLLKLSLPGSCQPSPHPKEVVLSLPAPVERDVVGNSARALYMGEFNRNDVTRCEIGHPNAENLPAEPCLGSSKALDDLVRETIDSMKKEVQSSSSDTSVSGNEPETRTGSQNGIASDRQTDLVEVVLSTPEKRVPSGDPPNLNGISEEVKTISSQSERLQYDKSSGSFSGGGSDESSEQNEDSPDIVPNLPGDCKSSSSDGSSAESEGEEGSKPVSPTEGSVGNDSDQTSSDGDSSQPSNAIAESENRESSSEESDQAPPTAGDETKAEAAEAKTIPAWRIMDFTTLKGGSGAARSIGRRSLGGSINPKYQYARDSRNGSDELINLSQRKSLVISGSQQELQPPAEAHDSLAPISLADDSHPNDLVQDKEVGNLNKCAILEKKDGKPTQENVTVRRSVRQKDQRTAASVRDGGEGEERFHGRSGPPTLKLGEAPLLLSVREELILSGEGRTENGPEPGEGPPPQARSGTSQKIHAALQLARMTATNGMESNVEARSKRKTGRKKGISTEAIPVTQANTLTEESSQQTEPRIRGESVDLLPEGDDQRLEANLLLSPDQIMAGAEGLGNVLRAPEATEGINKLEVTNADENPIGATEKVASDADYGRKKQRKRRNKFCQSKTEVTQQDIRGYMTSKPSQGLDRPKNASDEAGNKETSGKTPRKRKLATDRVGVENVALVLQQDGVPNSLNKKEREVAEEKMASQLSSRWVCTICDPSLSYTKRATLTRHLSRVHNLEKDDITSDLLQKVECQREGPEEVENTSQLHVAVNQKISAMGRKRQLEDTEQSYLGSEDLSQRASVDDEIKKEGRQVAGPVKEFGSQVSAKVELNGEPTQNKDRRKLAVEFAKDPSRLKKSRKGKKDRGSNLNPTRDHSALVSQEVDLVSHKELQGQETEQAGRLVLEKHSNVDEENEADEEYTAVENERKDSKRVRKSSKLSKKARNLKSPLMTDENIGRGGNTAEDVTIPFGSFSVEPAEADFPRGLPENLQGQHSNVGQKKKRKKSRNLDPAVEGTEAHQVELVDDEDQIATQELQEGLTTANLQNSNNKEGDKKSRKEKLQQLGFLRKDGVSLGKDSNSKKNGIGMFIKSQQITFSGCNLPGKSKANKSAEGRKDLNQEDGQISKEESLESARVWLLNSSTGAGSQRLSNARTKPEKPAKQDCPYGCGKEHKHKTSAYYRHLKACPLAPGPQIG